MQRLRNPQLVLILMFVGIIAAVPLCQAVLELSRGQRPQALQILHRKPTAANLRAYEHSLEDASWIAAKFRPLAQYVQFAWLKDGGEKALVGRDGWLFYGPGVQYSTERPTARAGNSTAGDAVAAIIDLRNQLAGRGIQLLVIPVPDKESVYPEKLTRRAAGRPTSPGPDTQQLLNALRAARIETVDLFEQFTACKGNTRAGSAPFYLATDSHWSPAGVELAAGVIAQRLLELGWIKPGRVPYELKPAPTRRVGDILRMLQVPALQRDELAETASCRQVLNSDTRSLYHDDGGSEILVLGDSFLRIYQTDEPEGAGFIAHLARQLSQPVASIVNDGGASTLVRQELNRRPTLLANKKVVIWEFVERDIRLGTEGWQPVPLPARSAAVPAAAASQLHQSKGLVGLSRFGGAAAGTAALLPVGGTDPEPEITITSKIKIKTSALAAGLNLNLNRNPNLPSPLPHISAPAEPGSS